MSTANASHKGQPLEVEGGVAAAGAGVLTGSGDGPAVAAGVVAAAAGVLTESAGGVPADTAGVVVTPAVVADCLR